MQDSIDIVTHDVQDSIHLITHDVQDSIHILIHVQDSIHTVIIERSTAVVHGNQPSSRYCLGHRVLQ